MSEIFHEEPSRHKQYHLGGAPSVNKTTICICPHLADLRRGKDESEPDDPDDPELEWVKPEADDPDEWDVPDESEPEPDDPDEVGYVDVNVNVIAEPEPDDPDADIDEVMRMDMCIDEGREEMSMTTFDDEYFSRNDLWDDTWG